ncbi:hypothetical protein BJV77DRAFT_1015930 [Russula vinacea]|nr:hypothetical protein BJV77DRAFT_1015930 [Russula vinacea]
MSLTDVSGSGLLIANSLLRAAKNVKIYQSQCEHLSRQCLDLASALCDHSDKLEGTGAQQAVDEVERVLTHILSRVHKWEELGKMKSFVKQTEIRLGLDASYQELRTCSMRFNIALHLDASSRSRELEEIRRRDHDELVEMMTRALQDNNLLKMELATSTLEDAHGAVEAIEQELREADVGDTQEKQLQEDFGELRRWVEGLPPMVDLSGKVSRTSDHPIALGGSQDIYTGEWTGQEVALAYPRNQSRAAQERFRRQVEIWRTLRHPNILQLLGIAYTSDLRGDFVYSVSPYMEFGHVRHFLEDHPDADRVLLLKEIASASEYLHMNGIIHGDLQGSSVLISGDGHACIGDLGSARVEEVPVTEAITYGSLRWLAPELVAESCLVPTTRATDVWSFGMLALEIFTDNVPFSHISNEAFIPLVVRDGPLPTQGLSDALWDLMNQCWQHDPKSPILNNSKASSRSGRHPSSNTTAGSLRGSSFSSAAGVPGSARPSALSLSRPSIPTGLTPPTAPVPIPRSLGRDEAELVQIQRGNPASFPLRKSPILSISLSSSPPSGLTWGPRSAPKSTPFPQNRSPLSSSFQTPLPSTAPESRTSASSPDDHPDWSLKPPLYSPESSISSDPELSLLLQPIIVTPSSKPGSVDDYRRTGSTSTGSIRSTDKSTSTSSSGDTEPLLRRTADGTVEAGTLEGLVDRLIKDTHNRAKDSEFRRVFLATYPLFTTGEDLFKISKDASRNLNGRHADFHLSGSTRYSILLVLRTWLHGESELRNRDLLSSIRDFARSVGGSDTMTDAAQEIANLADERMNVVVVSPTSPSQPLHGTTLPSPTPEHFKPEDIANSLSVIEGEFYSKITQADYIAHLRGTPITTHIASATRMNNRLVNWVKVKIVWRSGNV